MSIDAVEQAAYDLLVAELPGFITDENARHDDGMVIPDIVAFRRGPVVTIQDTDVDDTPWVGIGTYIDRPLADAGAASGLGAAATSPNANWGSEVERPIVITLVMDGSSREETHIRTVRAVDAIKRWARSHVDDNLAGTLMYWPYDLEAQWDPPLQLTLPGAWVQLSLVEVARAKTAEGPDE